MRNFFWPLIAIIFLSSCFTAHKTSNASISGLKFLGEYDVTTGKDFKGTVIGGLSGIDYDKKNNLYYIISDDRSNINLARFYTARIFVTEKGIDSVQFTAVTALRGKDGKPFPNAKQDSLHVPDPEAIRFNPIKDELVWSSEGERIVRPGRNILEDPSVIAMDRKGFYKDSFALPANMHMHETENGPRQNGVFEGMTFSNDFKYLFVNVEEPIYEDGPRAGLNDSSAWIRIIKFDAETKQPVAQYAYKIDPVAHAPNPSNAFKINGVPDILCVNKNRMLVIERSFSTGRLACTIKIFLADLRHATNVEKVSSLKSQLHIKAIRKKLLLNMDELGRYIDNIEGVAFGPSLKNGHRSLIFVSDDNFFKEQKTQFLLFEVLD